ncbi:NADP-dependent oxidoreductase [Arachidicoccus terrestris]|uniref:NADP-dependent oxidoreductase n=1 Tax=Arachidicoccus terrestris TaxID=2875539 RepID=UPI001CC54B16|nr:NADP-dependent oxidoreductase [Arachidicoccus terrestris]UAY55999.1 NADP-dependent oxidoreductase [Arachidicoccus terrestris]
MKAIIVAGQDAGIAGMKLEEYPDPEPSLNDAIVQVYASGFTNDELTWPSTWVDREGRDRSPAIPGHEVAGIVTALGYGATGVSIGQRVFGLTDWHRNGSLAEYVAVETRNLAPLPADVDFNTGAGLVMSGLTAWQGLFTHGHLRSGQTVLIHGAAGVVGSMAVQLAREAGAYIIGTGRASGRQAAVDFGVHEYLDLENEQLEDIKGVDLVFDVFGGEISNRSVGLIRSGGALVSVAGPTDARPANGTVIDFVVETSLVQLDEIVQRYRQGRLRTHIGSVAALEDAVALFNAKDRRGGKTIIEIGS